MWKVKTITTLWQNISKKQKYGNIFNSMFIARLKCLSLSFSHTPEVLRAQHLGVVHDFTLVRGDLQGGQHVVHSGQVGGRARGHVVELPLEDVETWPACDVGALRKD